MLEKCVLIILELNWNQRLGHKKTKLNICHSMLTSSTQLQNRSFHVAERTRKSTKCQKIKNARAKRAKILFFIVKYVFIIGSLSNHDDDGNKDPAHLLRVWLSSLLCPVDGLLRPVEGVSCFQAVILNCAAKPSYLINRVTY